MTREEAIKRLEWLRMVGNHVDSVTLGKEDMPYFDMALSALREQETKTNADHIRSMTDEELADFIIRGTEYDQFFVDKAFSGSCDGWLEHGEFLRWLKQPYEEEV